MEPIIIGIDPGNTTAYACISMDGKALEVDSRRHFSLHYLIEDIYQWGNPIILGTDKKEPPALIQEFSHKTGAIIVTPSYDTKKGEKKKLVAKHQWLHYTKNVHEIDALASALYGLREYRVRIAKLQQFAKENNALHYLSKLYILVFTKGMHPKQALSFLQTKPKEIIAPIVAPKHIITESTPQEKEIALLKKVLAKKKREIKELQNRLQLEQNKHIDIDDITRRIINQKEKRALLEEKKSNILQKQVHQLTKSNKEINDIVIKTIHYQSIPYLDNFESSQLHKITAPIIYVAHPQPISQSVLIRLQSVEYVICPQASKQLSKYVNVITLAPKYKSQEVALFDPQVLEKAKQRSKKDKKVLLDMIQAYKKERLHEII